MWNIATKNQVMQNTNVLIVSSVFRARSATAIVSPPRAQVCSGLLLRPVSRPTNRAQIGPNRKCGWAGRSSMRTNINSSDPSTSSGEIDCEIMDYS